MDASEGTSASAGEDEVPVAKVSKEDISKVMLESGPIVTCVLLRHMRPDGKDTKPHVPSSPETAGQHHRPVLTELIDEIKVDTTPSNNQIAQVLGGPFTFVGQFPTEGTVVMARKELEVDSSALALLPVKALRELCRDWDVDSTNMVEKSELVTAILEAAPELPINPHKLQPPLDDLVLRGDLLLLKVAEAPEDEDEEGADIKVMSNDEFFLDYTKKEYVAFAARTDVEAPPPPSPSEDDDDDDDPPYEFESEEEEKRAMLNLILGEVIKQFREDNGRGPDTRELLELRSQVAEKLGVEVATFDDINDNGEKKRSADSDPTPPSPKRVKFTAEDENYKEEDVEDSKPAAKPSGDEEGETQD